MATYHLSVKTAGRNRAQAHAAYITRAGARSRNAPNDLVATRHGNMPAWATVCVRPSHLDRRNPVKHSLNSLRP